MTATAESTRSIAIRGEKFLRKYNAASAKNTWLFYGNPKSKVILLFPAIAFAASIWLIVSGLFGLNGNNLQNALAGAAGVGLNAAIYGMDRFSHLYSLGSLRGYKGGFFSAMRHVLLLLVGFGLIIVQGLTKESDGYIGWIISSVALAIGAYEVWYTRNSVKHGINAYLRFEALANDYEFYPRMPGSYPR